MSNHRELQGQTAVITGGGRGIGAAVARRLAALGATVIICGRSLPTLRKTASAIEAAGGECLAVQCNLQDLSSVEYFAAEVRKHFQSIHILVNNAGVGAFEQPLHKMEPEEWDKVINTNLRGAFYMIRSFVPLILAGGGGGHVINISSLAGKNALPNGAAYAASKWALNGLSYSVAEELRSQNIRVSVICPGSVNTELSPHAGKDQSKMLQPEDVAHAVAGLVTQAPQSFMSEVLLRPTQKP
jgi:NAD(P)-dependent dehydrogenase (short-subunit alcohol dehydrogenase family)